MRSSVAVERGAVSPEVASVLTALEREVAGALEGKRDVVRLALAALLARGHVLIEDVPGVGKTTLAAAMARAAGGGFSRVQFTSDLMPSDLVGVTVFDPRRAAFRFRPGPVFAHVLLADEINRASPRTQSALLEAMAERCVTVDGTTHALPEPFFVVATQNPIELHGTQPLPEAQLDRFALRLTIGYPAAADERAVYAEVGPARREDAVRPVVDPASLAWLQSAADEVHVDESLIDYAVRIAAATRRQPQVALGVSPRAGRELIRTARALALLSGRAFVTPDDLVALAVPALAHRIVLAGGRSEVARGAAAAVVRDVIAAVAAPR